TDACRHAGSKLGPYYAKGGFMNGKMSLRKRILLGYLVPILLLVGASVIIYMSAQTLERVSGDLERANSIVRDVGKYQTETERMMRAVRAYMITNDKRALEMYQGAQVARRELADALGQR